VAGHGPLPQQLPPFLSVRVEPPFDRSCCSAGAQHGTQLRCDTSSSANRYSDTRKRSSDNTEGPMTSSNPVPACASVSSVSQHSVALTRHEPLAAAPCFSSLRSEWCIHTPVCRHILPSYPFCHCLWQHVAHAPRRIALQRTWLPTCRAWH